MIGLRDSSSYSKTEKKSKEVINLEVRIVVFREAGGDNNLEETQDEFQGYWKCSVS